MYYLLKPNATVQWADISEYMIERLQKDNPDTTVDYSRFPWQPSDRNFDAGNLNLALRYGIAVPGGLAVAGRDLVDFDYYRNMEAILDKENRRDAANLPNADFFEAIMPGWTQSGRELDQRILESQRATVERARRDMLRSFAKPMDTALEEHWTRLGGSIPPQPPPAN